MWLIDFLFGSKEYRENQKRDYGETFQKDGRTFIRAASGADALDRIGNPSGCDGINRGGGVYEIRERGSWEPGE